MGKYVIDGLFLTQRITGIQRYAYEITMELDKIVQPNLVEILVPESYTEANFYKNISLVRYGKAKGIVWQQVDFGIYARKKKLQCICFTNVVPLYYARGIVAIHDVSYKANPHFFTSYRDRLSAFWHRLHYWRVAHSQMKIITVSEFSKSEIIRFYGVKSERISVVYSAWQHVIRITSAQDIFDRYPELKNKDYYFTMSTLASNKNFKWILYAAKNNPNQQFAIAGGGKLKGAAEAEGLMNLSNIRFLGYVSDEEGKALMANCKAFLFPTLYEGFGLPPLEAVACGCSQIIISDTPCMHEIFQTAGNYIDPNNYSDNCFDLTHNMEANISHLLENYSWRRSAEKLKRLL